MITNSNEMNISTKLKKVENDLLQLVDYVGILNRNGKNVKVNVSLSLVRIELDVKILKYSLEYLQAQLVETKKMESFTNEPSTLNS